jgi:hypothetical protein
MTSEAAAGPKLIEVQKTYALIYQGMMLTLRDMKRVPATIPILDRLTTLKEQVVAVLKRQCPGGFLTAEDTQLFKEVYQLVDDGLNLVQADPSLTEIHNDGTNYCLEAVALMGYHT